MEPMTFDTPGMLTLEVRIPSGGIVVKATDTSVTTLEIRGERDPDDFRIACDEVHAGGDRLTIEYRGGKLFGWRGTNLQAELWVPVRTDIAAQTGSADLDVTGSIGTLTFKSGSGDCRFDRVDRDASVKTASGDLSGTGTGGGLTFHSASGAARVREVAGDVVARTASGEVSLGAVRGSVDVTTVSGDVEVGELNAGRASIRSVSGDVDVRVSRGNRVYLDLSSTSGETVSELDMAGGAATDGAADLELRVGTVSGDVRVSRATADAART